MDRLLGLLGIAKKAGFLEIGEECVAAAARKSKAQIILSAADAADASKRHAQTYCESYGALYALLPHTKAELGMVLGRGSPGMLAITDTGLAAKLASLLAAENAQAHGNTAEALAARAARVKQRSNEAAAHKRNIKTGKRRTMQ